MIRHLLHSAPLLLALNIPSAHAGDAAGPENWNLHGQLTLVAQRHDHFASPYEGANSLKAAEGTKTTLDATAFLGLRLWQGAEFYLNPEIDRGFGLSDTLGVGGFPSGEAYKVGHHSAYGKLPRAFLRQVVVLSSKGSEAGETQDSAANQLAGTRPADNLTFTLGKFSIVDLFDTNAYAHDPRADFLNWAVIDAGAFDYAADSWGYSLGAAAEWNQGDWSARVGLFTLSREPNGTRLDASFAQHQWVAEAEHRHQLGGRPGKLKLLAFASLARMGRYDDAVALGAPVDTARVRQAATKQGFAINAEQELAANLGGFLRYSRNDGRTEAFDFTDINRSLSLGLSLNGAAWSQPGHTLGIALAMNSLSGAAQRYFAAGGLGILVGDGRLGHYASEQIAEAYYAMKLAPGLSATLDLQRLRNPGYNAERGPANVLGVRLHSEF
ncbi:carbohydrate porin [Roseateles saccharophilus]|uniref:High affinity Mn2+ porin n=1 Tax=Roseateles saccharophilus TaxID=304 RepID=A0A4R3VHP0_ROSSA|nr:carbohydrate porin [Roseateles saccharophilus]MDG0832788.1 carbohydrate porin [Roseateles saccharophilus]TCV03851.1 high affinity Mn2+ porin [Roseateles saccharophilus]